MGEKPLKWIDFPRMFSHGKWRRCGGIYRMLHHTKTKITKKNVNKKENIEQVLLAAATT